MVIKILGYIITYKPKYNYGRTLINYALFGRIVSQTKKRKNIAYYTAGYLDNIKHNRLKNSNVFVRSLEGIDLEVLNSYADITVTKVTVPEIEMYTGREYWAKHAKEKGVVLRVKQRKTNN